MKSNDYPILFLMQKKMIANVWNGNFGLLTLNMKI